MTSTPRRTATAVLAAALLATAVPAAAQTRTMQPARADAAESTDDGDRYRSLTLNLATWHAGRADADLGSFLSDRKLAAEPLQLRAGNLGQVARQLADQQQLPELRIAGDLDGFRARLSQDRSLDGAAAALGARFATTAASLQTGDLTLPDLPQDQFSQIAPDDALVFGQLYKNSLTVLAADNASKLDGAIDRKAFDDARARAADLTKAELGDSLAAPCYASLITSAATGDRSASRNINGSRDCGSCEIAGLYMHNEWNRLADGNWDTLGVDSQGDRLTIRDLDALDPQVRDHLERTRPNLADDVDGLKPDAPRAPGHVTKGCAGADEATGAAARQMVPNAADALSRLFD